MQLDTQHRQTARTESHQPADSEEQDESEQDEEGKKGSEDNDECDEECEDDEDGDEDEEEENTGRKQRFYQRGLHAWSELAVYNRTAMLDTEIDAAILAVATDKMQDSGLMEWPEMKRVDKKKTISLWVQNCMSRQAATRRWRRVIAHSDIA